jgi:hypothetical protein
MAIVGCVYDSTALARSLGLPCSRHHPSIHHQSGINPQPDDCAAFANSEREGGGVKVEIRGKLRDNTAGRVGRPSCEGGR